MYQGKLFFLSLINIYASLLIGCGDDMAVAKREVRELEKTIPTIQEHHITLFGNTQSVKYLHCAKGAFGPDSESVDEEVAIVFDSLAKQIGLTGMQIRRIDDIIFDATGTLLQAKFHRYGGFIRVFYIYSPGYKELPTDGFEQYHSRINDNWFRLLEDWN